MQDAWLILRAVVNRQRPPLISTGAAAAVAGCHPVTILRAIERGEPEAVRLGRRGDHRVYVDALNGWMRPAGEAQEPST